MSTPTKNDKIQMSTDQANGPSEKEMTSDMNTDRIVIELVKKTKKNEARIFKQLMLVDRDAFESCGQSNTVFIMKQFWQSSNNKIIVAKKRDTGAVLGYAIFSVGDPVDQRFGKKKRIDGVYLLRIGVRLKCQRQGIGRKLMDYLLTSYPHHALTLDVSTDNDRAVRFYQRVGLQISDIYLSMPDNVEFALFETPLDKRGKKIMSAYETKLRGETLDNTGQTPIQKYWQSLDEYHGQTAVIDEKAEQPVAQIRKDQSALLPVPESQTETRFNTPMKIREVGDAQDSISIKTADNTEQSLTEGESDADKSPVQRMDEKDE